jgi:hypothetical protein
LTIFDAGAERFVIEVIFTSKAGRRKCAPAFWDKIFAIWAMAWRSCKRRGWKWMNRPVGFPKLKSVLAQTKTWAFRKR